MSYLPLINPILETSFAREQILNAAAAAEAYKYKLYPKTFKLFFYFLTQVVLHRLFKSRPTVSTLVYLPRERINTRSEKFMTMRYSMQYANQTLQVKTK